MKCLVMCTLLVVAGTMTAAEGDTRNKIKRSQMKSPPKSPKSPKMPESAEKLAMVANLGKLAGLSAAEAIEASHLEKKS